MQYVRLYHALLTASLLLSLLVGCAQPTATAAEGYTLVGKPFPTLRGLSLAGDRLTFPTTARAQFTAVLTELRSKAQPE